MDREQAIHSIRKLFEEACIEQFQSLSCNVLEMGEMPFDTAKVPMACIDAGCSDFEIEINLHLPFSALAMTYPANVDILKIDEGELEDWICELSNRLLGKLKTKLHVHGCDLDTGLPDYTYSYEAYERKLDGRRYFVYHYDVDCELFEASLSIESMSDELSFHEEIVDDSSGIDDGELEFF